MVLYIHTDIELAYEANFGCALVEDDYDALEYLSSSGHPH